jgi:quercetin dioxygenase-like cupin family protein
MTDKSRNKTKRKKRIKHVEKGWGHEKWIVNKKEYCGKLLYFKKGKQSSWHYHKLKDEVMFVQSGKVKILYNIEDDIENAKSITLHEGQAFHIPTGLVHRIIAIRESQVFEFSTQHFDSDSIRIQKGD